ncbi:MAG TPA: dTDP-4-dehydrorhamnose reductase [Thermoleophilaceae bacterium]|nr:dTDP-4-dehydrorhamnose reductase [Thermoleophilaceae bacterium]
MRILVTGAGGMLGSEVVRAARADGHEVVALDRAALDVTAGEEAARSVAAERPDAVVNCAAYTDVDGAEDDLRAAMEANAEGAGTVARGAAAAGASVVYPSSDYVFDGRGRGRGEPYVESDEPRPVSIYAQSKLAGERATIEACERHFVARSAWLFGLGGRNFVETMLRLAAEHGEVVVVRDQVGSPTYTGHLAQGILRLLGTAAYGVHHLAGGGECSWHEFAVEIFERAGVDCRVASCTTEEMARPAPRPPYSALATERAEAPPLPEWQLGLETYLRERSAVAGSRSPATGGRA